MLEVHDLLFPHRMQLWRGLPSELLGYTPNSRSKSISLFEMLAAVWTCRKFIVPKMRHFRTPILCYTMHTHRHKAFACWARPEVSRESYIHFRGYCLHLPPDVLVLYNIIVSSVPYRRQIQRITWLLSP